MIYTLTERIKYADDTEETIVSVYEDYDDAINDAINGEAFYKEEMQCEHEENYINSYKSGATFEIWSEKGDWYVARVEGKKIRTKNYLNK